MTEKKLLTVKETAQLLGVPLQWLHYEVKLGRFPCFTVGKKKFCEAGAAEAYMLELLGETEPAEDTEMPATVF